MDRHGGVVGVLLVAVLVVLAFQPLYALAPVLLVLSLFPLVLRDAESGTYSMF